MRNFCLELRVAMVNRDHEILLSNSLLTFDQILTKLRVTLYVEAIIVVVLLMYCSSMYILEHLIHLNTGLFGKNSLILRL